ncbi:MAG: hypothetical protein R2788_15935 [Saprospiraceae bacterium]
MQKKETGNNSLTINDLERDEDVVDTWFSSWLWRFLFSMVLKNKMN